MAGVVQVLLVGVVAVASLGEFPLMEHHNYSN